MNICKPVLAPLVFEGQLFVLDPQQMQNRRIEVMHVDGILGDVVAVIIGAAMHMPLLHPGAAQQGGETPGMVVTAPVLVWRLGVNGPAELPSPDNQGVV